jgi:organic radical activating enzyme
MGTGKILARSVEVNLTAHCNLACYGCDHASPVHAEEYLSVEEFAKDLAALAPVYHVFEFLLTGGEPLLHPRLLDVIDTIRRSGVAEKITLMTNGVLLHKAPEALWSKIDKIGVSVYPGVNRKLDERQISDLAVRHGLLLWYKPTDTFTTKLLHGENRDPDLVQTIYSTCTLRTSCHTIHKGRYFKCSPSPFLPDWLDRLGLDSKILARDGVPLRDNPDLHDQLTAYLRDEKPLAACSYCLGCVGRTVPLRQMNKAAARQWLSEKDPEVRELIDWDEVATAKRKLERTELTGLLPRTTGRRARWLVTLWAKRLLGLELTQSF